MGMIPALVLAILTATAPLIWPSEREGNKVGSYVPDVCMCINFLFIMGFIDNVPQ